jgi:outer membrane protein OmpA-like peptidoglycan-associated protein
MALKPTGRKALLMVAALMVGGCRLMVEPTTVPPAAVTTTETTVPGPSQVYEVLAIASHPNGTQLRVDRIEVLADSVVVSGAITNGSLYGISVHRGLTQLRSDRGDLAVLIDRLAASEIVPGEELAFTLRFTALPDPAAVTLILNSGQGGSLANPNTATPSFELGPLRLDPESARPPLPEPVPIRRAVVAPSGIELQIEGINFTENRIGVWVRISNPLPAEARIAPTFGPSLIVDDLGNRYPLVLPADEGWLTIPAGTARSGVLSFAGRIHPEAKVLNLGINTGSGGGVVGNVIRPELLAPGIPLTGQNVAAPLPADLSIGQARDHPAGVHIEVSRLAFSPIGAEMTVTITNSRNDGVTLASAPTYLIDDLGNRQALVALFNNPQLAVPARTTVEGTFAFVGRVSDHASEISIVFNAGQSTDDASTRQPSFNFGPFPLQRPDDPVEPVEARLFAVGAHSRLVADNIAVSQIDQITQTLRRFGAIEVEGGFQLTLPDSILFDFGSAQLRPDAAQALTLLAEVLRYFEGDQVVIVGHTDSVGSATANQRLSEQRAQTVVQALIGDQGIAAGRLTAEGRGASEPVAPNRLPDGTDNPEGRALNRRVEIVVLTTRDLPSY